MSTPRRPIKSRSHLYRQLAIGAAGVMGLMAGLGLWWQYHQPTAPQYTGPRQSISTGLIGEYAALILIAEEQGFFAAQGLDVTIKDYPSGPAALADLLAGKLDTAMGSDFAGVSQSFASQDLQILGTMSKSEAFYLIGRTDHDLHQIADLKGKKIGVTRQTVGEFYLGQFLTFNQLQLNQVTLVDLSQQALIQALQAGQVDAAVLFEPNAYRATSDLGSNAIRWSVQSGGSIYSLLYTTNRLTTSRPKVVERYLRAVVQAEQFTKDHNQQARTIVAKRLHYDTAYLNYIWPKFIFEVSLDQELILNMEDEARWAMENHLTTSTKLPNYLHQIYTPALEAAKPQAVTIIH